MKKILTTCAVIAMAVVVNAATVKWTAANIYTPDADPAAKAGNYLVYFVSSSDYSLANANAALGDGDISFLASYGQASALTGSTGTASNTITTEAGNGESWTGYLVILNAATTADATMAYLTEEATKATGASGQMANLTFTALTGTQNSANWQAIPEPTSGLLMLVGLAGLALRRRRA